MIDTVRIRIPKNKLTIPQHIWQSFSQAPHVYKWIRNTTSTEKKQNLYFPKITGIKRVGQIYYVTFEFSCPKIVYRTNLFELTESDFDELVLDFQKSLAEIEIQVDQKSIKEAEVMAYHASKNLMITGGYTASYIIKQLYRIDTKKIFDLTKTTFQNGGQSLQVYTNSHSLVFYDKIADLKKPAKRAIDKDQTSRQKTLFDLLTKEKPIPEVLRMEVRLCNKRKISSLHKKLGLPIKPKFEDLFKYQTCQKILLDYWNDIAINHNSYLFSLNTGSLEIINALIRDSPEINRKELLYLLGLVNLTKNDELKATRAFIEKIYSNKTWQRISADLKRIDKALQSHPKEDWISQINKQLKEFKTIKSNLACKEK